MPGVTKVAPRPVASLQVHWRREIEDHTIALAWSPDGRTLAAASVSGPITLFDGSNGKVRATLKGHSVGTIALSWHRDGLNAKQNRLASAGQDGKVRVWDTATGEELFALSAGSLWVERVAYSPDGTMLAAAAGRKVLLWDGNGALLREFSDHASTVADITWTSVPGKQELASASYGSVTLWLPDQPEPAHRFSWKGSTLVLAWSPDGKYIATGDQDSTVHFWYVSTGQDLQMWGYEAKVRELSWDHTSRYLATGGSPTVVVWDCSGAGPEGTTPLMLKGHEDVISALAYQQRGELLASGAGDGRVVVWQPKRGRSPIGRNVVGLGVSQLAWSPDDRLLAAGDESGTVAVYRV